MLYYFKNAITGELNSTDPAALAGIFTGMMSSPKILILYQLIFMLLTIVIVVNGIKRH